MQVCCIYDNGRSFNTEFDCVMAQQRTYNVRIRYYAVELKF